MGYLAVLEREIKIFIKTPILWWISFFIPLSMCLLICLIFSHSSPTNLPIAVLNEDNSQLSRTIIRSVDSMQSCSVDYIVSSLREGNELLQKGDIYGFIVIPKDFQRDMYRIEQPKIIFYYNNQRILIGGIISKDVLTALKALEIGLDAKIRMVKGTPRKIALKQANLINVVEHVRSNPYFNYQYFLSLIAFGHILQICIIFTSVFAIGREFKYGKTKIWLKTADNSILTAFLGKETLYLGIYAVVFLILYGIYFISLNAPFEGNLLLVMLCSLIFIASCLSLGVFFMSINGSLRYGLSNSAFYVAMGFAFAGITYPKMAMPFLGKLYSSIIPLSYWIQIMLDQTIRKIPEIYDIKHFIYMIILMAFGLLCLKRLKKLALKESSWYKS